MKIVQVINSKLPVSLYGGTERVVWYLGKELNQLGHQVVFLCKKGSSSDFAEIIEFEDNQNVVSQIPKDADIVHFHSDFHDISTLQIPYVITLHGNINHPIPLDKNTVFVSKNHANRFGSNSYVYNGLDWSDYTTPVWTHSREYFHFLGNAAWRVKNVKGAIAIAKRAKEKIRILGGVRFNFNMGLRFTFTPKAKFFGMVGGERKDKLLMRSKGLIFPVKWDEPFGLAIIESLYYGCPVFGTPYGSLPELVNAEVGFLSNSEKELVKAIKSSNLFSKENCHLYAKNNFNSRVMANNYISKYQEVLNGNSLNQEYPILQNKVEKFLPYYKN